MSIHSAHTNINNLFTMAKKSIYNPTYIPKRMNRNNPAPVSDTELPLPIERPGHCIGRLLALQQLDGVDGSTNQLFKGQYDDAFGDLDPASDIHTDRHILQDALLNKAYNSKMSSD